MPGVLRSSRSDGRPASTGLRAGCSALVAKRRCDCSRGFQPPVRLAIDLASRQRRGDRCVRVPSASPPPTGHPVATRRRFTLVPVRGLKPPATLILSLRDAQTKLKQSCTGRIIGSENGCMLVFRHTLNGWSENGTVRRGIKGIWTVKGPRPPRRGHQGQRMGGHPGASDPALSSQAIPGASLDWPVPYVHYDRNLSALTFVLRSALMVPRDDRLSNRLVCA